MIFKILLITGDYGHCDRLASNLLHLRGIVMTLPSTEDSYLIQCIAYIDLNMVRAGVARHSRPGPFCQYNEIENQR